MWALAYVPTPPDAKLCGPQGAHQAQVLVMTPGQLRFLSERSEMKLRFLSERSEMKKRFYTIPAGAFLSPDLFPQCVGILVTFVLVSFLFFTGFMVYK